MDEDAFELAERRLAEKVEARVRRRLLWPITVVIAVFAFFGYDFLGDMKQAAVDAARDSVQPAVSRADEVAEQAAARVREARVEVEASRRMLDLIEEWMTERRQKLTEMEDDISARAEAVTAAAETMRAQLQGLGDRIRETEDEIEAQRARAEGLYAGAGNLTELAGQVKALAEQVRSLDRQIGRLAEGGEAATVAPVEQFTQRSAAIESIATAADRIGAAPAEDAERPAEVFVHFSTADRELIDRLSAALAAEGWTLPGAQRVKLIPEEPQVRYFFEADRETAEQVAAAAGRWLEARGFSGGIAVQDLTDYRGAKPRPGVLELWLDPRRD